MSAKLFKDYVPEILIYDPEIDGSYEHKVRDEHLNAKEKVTIQHPTTKNGILIA